MKLNLLTLKFAGNSSKLEAPFLSDYYRVSLLPIRISLVLGSLLYASFGILDAVLMPEQKYTIWFIRFGIVCPVLFATLLASFSKPFERCMQPLLTGVFILAGGGIIYMIVIAPPPVNYFHNAGLLLVLMWGYTFIRIRFTWASLAGWVQVVLYEIAAIWISPTPYTVLFNNSFFFISANVIGMLACYSIEFYARRDFFLRQRLKIEQEKVKKVNQELEGRVEKRTTDYQIINRELEQEITGHEQAAEALRASESKYRFMTDNVADIIWTVDMNLNFTYISPSVQRFRGLTVEEAMSQKIHEVLTPASLQYALKIMEEENKALMGNPDHIKDKLTIELEEYCKDGSTIWTENELKYLPGEDGKPIGIIGVTHDISERKRVEEVLRQSNEQYRLLANHTTDIVWLINRNLETIYISPNVEKIRGFTPQEVMEIPPEKHLTPESFKLAYEIFTEELPKVEAALDYNPVHSLELELYRKDGTTFWAETKFSVIRDGSGKPVSILGEGREITERKLAEEEKRRLEERLQHADKMEAIGTLAGGIAHDFNNLLMGIQGYVSLLLMSLDPSNPNYEKLKRIEEQVQSGVDLTSQLLGFAHGGRYEVKPIDMNEFIEKTSSLFGRTKKEISIHRKHGKDLWSVDVDGGQMEQVFLNLYVNAWQAMPGGGEIYLETQNVLLNDEQALSYSVKPGKYVKITVTDTGTGMDEKTRERIFDPFFTTKEMGRGTGLEMATVYGIIKGHQGMIHVYSEPGQGTTFTIYLPASDKEVIKETTATGKIVRGTETILVVDDEEMVLEVNRELLEFMGYRVYAAGSGQKAISVYMEKRNEIDLVILDMIMPGYRAQRPLIVSGKSIPGSRFFFPAVTALLEKPKQSWIAAATGSSKSPFNWNNSQARSGRCWTETALSIGKPL